VLLPLGRVRRAGEAGDKILRISDALVPIDLFTYHAFLFPFYATRTTAMIKPIEIYAEPRADENNDWLTLIRAGIQYLVSFIEVKGLDFIRNDVYEFCGVPFSTGADIVASGIPRRE
jgi:hypothetical protein